jgi:hypothetical protein
VCGQQGISHQQERFSSVLVEFVRALQAKLDVNVYIYVPVLFKQAEHLHIIKREKAQSP